MDNQKFVANVRAICKAKGLSVSKVESDLGWSAGLISRWNKAYPSIEKVAELITYLGVSFEELLGDVQNAEQSDSAQLVEKLVEKTRQGKAKWSACQDNADAAELVAVLKNEDVAVELSYFYAYHKGYFFLVMVENEQLPLSLKLYQSAGKKMPPRLESDDADGLAPLLNTVDSELYEVWAANRAKQFRQEFLADDTI